MRLTDKVSIITGASSGIGRAAAYLFAREGAKIVVADIDDAGGAETVNTIKSNGGQAIFIHTDISRVSDAQSLVTTTKEKFGRVDILYNDAGIADTQVPLEEIAESTWEHTYDVNVKGTFLVTKYVVPEMKKAASGVIINTASMLGIRPRPDISAYASSKGAIITLTKALALELAPYHIRVNCICPMLTLTPMLKNITEEERKKTASATPLGRLANPEDMAYTALYLASDESSMLTGTIMQVDGGGGI